MAWVSFVIVVLIFFNPFLGLGTAIPHDPIPVTMPFLGISVNIPYSGYLRMLFLSLVIWGALWLALVGLEWLIGSRWSIQAEKIGLRNRMMFALHPWEVSRVATSVAWIILGLTILKIVLDIIAWLLRTRVFGYLFDLSTGNLRSTSMGYIYERLTGNLGGGGGGFFNPDLAILPILSLVGSPRQLSVPVPSFPCTIIVLCLLTLIAAFAFKREQLSRYEDEVRRRQAERKKEYKDKRPRAPVSES